MDCGYWIRVSPTKRCPICGRPDWCLVAGDRTAAICARIQSANRRGEAGYLHRLVHHHDAAPHRVRRTIELPVARDWTRLANECHYGGACDLSALAHELGVAETSLDRLRVGRLGRCWTFPHEDGVGRICGIHLRASSGRKPFLRGSRPGIAVPIDLGPCAPLIVTEGESDCAAALSLGFDAIARPGCGSSFLALMNFVRVRRPRSIVVFGDNDEQGRHGAEEMGASLARLCRSVHVAFPAADAKDLRDWLRHGASQQDVRDAIAASALVQLALCVESPRMVR